MMKNEWDPLKSSKPDIKQRLESLFGTFNQYFSEFAVRQNGDAATSAHSVIPTLASASVGSFMIRDDHATVSCVNEEGKKINEEVNANDSCDNLDDIIGQLVDVSKPISPVPPVQLISEKAETSIESNGDGADTLLVSKSGTSREPSSSDLEAIIHQITCIAPLISPIRCDFAVVDSCKTNSRKRKDSSSPSPPENRAKRKAYPTEIEGDGKGNDLYQCFKNDQENRHIKAELKTSYKITLTGHCFLRLIEHQAARHKPFSVHSSGVLPARPARPVLSLRENTASAPKRPPFSCHPQLGKKSSSAEQVTQTKHAVTARTTTVFTGGRKIGGKIVTAPTINKVPKADEEKLMEKATADMDRAKQQLRDNAKAANVFVILSCHLNEKLVKADAQIAHLHALLDKRSAEHACSLEDLECCWQKRLQKLQEQHRKEIDGNCEKMRSEHKDQLQTIYQQHQQATNDLSEQVRKLETKLKEQEQKHRMELAESENETINRLNKELASREYELQMKGAELSKLRQVNRELQFEADKLPEKEAQNSRLKARNGDMREELDRLKQLEKKLLSQVEDLQYELGECRAKAAEMTKEKEVLEYHLTAEHYGTGSNTPLISQTPQGQCRFVAPVFTPTPVKVRTPELPRKTSGRPSSSCLSNGRPSISQRVECDMSRSMDSAVISCYMKEGRSKSQNTPTKIYTPRDIYEVPDPISTTQRTVDFDSQSMDSESVASDNTQK